MTLDELTDLLAVELGRDIAERAARTLARCAPGDVVYISRARPAKDVPAPTSISPAEVQRRYGVSRATAYRWVQAWKI